jgi:hypothetical protein
MEKKSRKSNPPHSSVAMAWRLFALFTMIAVLAPIQGAWAACNGMSGVQTMDTVDTNVTPPASIIRTKVAGIGFKLTVVALNTNGNNMMDNGAGCTVAITILGGTTVPADCSSGTELLTANVTVSGGSGTLIVNDGAIPDASRDVRVKMVYPDGMHGNASVTACSKDDFSIRPASFTISSNMNNTTTGGSPADTPPAAVARVLTPFNLTAQAVKGYDGAPLINYSKIRAHTNAASTGTLTASTPATPFGTAGVGNGTATGSFTYSEVGHFYFKAGGVYDDTFTTVDSNKSQCISGSSSNTPDSSLQVGCNIGNPGPADLNNPDPSYIGRFIPDHFVVSQIDNNTPIRLLNRSDLTSTYNSSFTYMGEPMTLKFNIAPKDSRGWQLNNYSGDYAKLVLTTSGLFNFAARDTTFTDTSVAGTTDTYLPPTRLTVGTASTVGWSGASADVAATVTVIRNATPDGPYDAFRLGINPVDSDGVTLLTTSPNPLNLDADPLVAGNDHQQVGVTKIRFGKMTISSAYGPETNSLPMPMEVQYCISGCSSTAPVFVKNGQDDLTPLVAGAPVVLGAPATVGNFLLTNKTGGLGAGYPGASLSGTGLFTAGAQSVLLPVPNVAGSLDVTYDLTRAELGATPIVPAMTYLQTGTNYAQNPTARATFGVYRNPSQLIYMRENF